MCQKLPNKIPQKRQKRSCQIVHSFNYSAYEIQHGKTATNYRLMEEKYSVKYFCFIIIGLSLVTFSHRKNISQQ